MITDKEFLETLDNLDKIIDEHREDERCKYIFADSALDEESVRMLDEQLGIDGWTTTKKHSIYLEDQKLADEIMDSWWNKYKNPEPRPRPWPTDDDILEYLYEQGMDAEQLMRHRSRSHRRSGKDAAFLNDLKRRVDNAG